VPGQQRKDALDQQQWALSHLDDMMKVVKPFLPEGLADEIEQAFRNEEL
jgi:hypothetical protein